MLDNPALLKELAVKEKSLFKRLWQSVMDFFDKLFSGWKKQSFSTMEGTLVKEATKQEQKELNTLFAKALRSANEAAKTRASERNTADAEIKYSFIGRTKDGRGIYRSNYPKNTPKTEKQKDIINLVQNVWSKKPITLNLIQNGNLVSIKAKFNPELAERSDLSKIAFGNRKGTNSEKRITLDLSSDIYQIAEESHHVGSKTEIGKDNPAHFGVSEWHYFLTNLVFVEDDGTNIDCYMNIDVKHNDSGHWFYSFAIEKGTAPRTLLAGVTEYSATVPINIIPDTAEKINTFGEKSSENSSGVSHSLSNFADREEFIESKTEEPGEDKDLTSINQGNMYVREGEKKYSLSNEIKYPSYDNEKINENIEKLAEMEPVAKIEATKLNKTGKAPRELFEEYFASLGNAIYSKEFGYISLGKSSVKSEIRHGLTAEKIASMEAIPDVIENGKVIFISTKNSDVERIVIAAPIYIGVQNYYIGVMLQRDTQTQYLYLHNVTL